MITTRKRHITATPQSLTPSSYRNVDDFDAYFESIETHKKPNPHIPNNRNDENNNVISMTNQELIHLPSGVYERRWSKKSEISDSRIRLTGDKFPHYSENGYESHSLMDILLDSEEQSSSFIDKQISMKNSKDSCVPSVEATNYREFNNDKMRTKQASNEIIRRERTASFSSISSFGSSYRHHREDISIDYLAVSRN